MSFRKNKVEVARVGHDDIKDFKNLATLHPYEDIFTKTTTAKELSVTGEKEKIKWSKLMQVRFSAKNKDILSFKCKYNDIAFKTMHEVNFSEATQTSNRGSYFKKGSTTFWRDHFGVNILCFY